ncbi:hypothetical protein [Pseudonocardia asaccharolytica]|nr:hypothetical protein [Pseudonocardia asaccharolytica]
MPDQELSGDYSYDLAHEVMVTSEAQRDRASRAPHDDVPAAAGTVEPEGDYGYDEAHDL